MWDAYGHIVFGLNYSVTLGPGLSRPTKERVVDFYKSKQYDDYQDAHLVAE